MKKHIPNALTCGNIACGCLGIIQALQGNIGWAAFFVVLGGVFDFFDGFAARILHVSSDIGKELDSLADMVTFGVLPGMIMMQMMASSDLASSFPYLKYAALLIPVFSGLRLAKFNIDTRQSESFIGVPTPANTLFISFLPVAAMQSQVLAGWLQNYVLLAIVTVVCSLMLVAELPLFALKFKNFGFADNKIRYIFIGLSVLMLVLLQYLAVPLIIFLYVLLSAINNAIVKSNPNQ